MIAIALALMLAQELPAEAVARIVERHERARRELEDSLVELGEAGLQDIPKLQDHPNVDVREAAGRALARIKKLAPEIKSLVEKLASDSTQERERATEDLMKLGAAARSYLDQAARGADREKALRAKGILLTLDPSGSRRASWSARADLEERALAQLKTQGEVGRVSRTEIDEAELRLLRARWKAEKIGSREYFTSKREMLTKALTHLEKLQQQGMVPAVDVIRSRLALAAAGRHLGAVPEEEVRQLRRRLWDHLAGLVEKGLLPESEALSRYAEWILDEDRDGAH